MLFTRDKNIVLSLAVGSLLAAAQAVDPPTRLLRSNRLNLQKEKRHLQGDDAEFLVNQKPQKSCDWISQTEERKINNCRKPNVVLHCPRACDGYVADNFAQDTPKDIPTVVKTGKATKASKNSKCNAVPFDLPDASKLGAEIQKYYPGKNTKAPKATMKLVDEGIDGDSINKYAWSSALNDDGDLYVGTFNINFNYAGLPSFVNSISEDGPSNFLKIWSGSPVTYSEGGAIYKLKKDGKKVERVLKAGHDHVGFRKGINYMGDMYFGSANSETGAKVFTNQKDKDTFTILADFGNLSPDDTSIRAMCKSSYSERLFMGTENLRGGMSCGPSIVAYDGRNGNSVSSWQSWDSCNSDIEWGNIAIGECTELAEGKMLFGTWNGWGYNLIVLHEDLGYFEYLRTPWLDHASNGVMELRVFQDSLYVGLLSYQDGFALIKATVENVLNSFGGWVKGARWEAGQFLDWDVITTSGFASEQREQLGLRKARNPYPWSSTVVDGTYYIGTFAGAINEGAPEFGSDSPVDIIDSRAQLWSSTDGGNWTIEEHDAFGEEFTYGFRTMQANDDGSLFIGTASNLFIPDGSRAPYTDYIDGLTGNGNDDICMVLDEFESIFSFMS